MRDKDTLKAFKDVAILQQYLFLNPCNHIMVETELSGRLALTMDDNADVWATPQVVGVSTFKYNSMLSCPVWMDILEQVKEQQDSCPLKHFSANSRLAGKKSSFLWQLATP